MTRFRLALLSSLTLAFLPACAQDAETTRSDAELRELIRDVISEDATALRVDVDDREAMEAVIKAYLIENPEVIEEALIELARREREALMAELVSDSRDFSIGPADAPITIVEFFDYRCGYCKRSMDWVLEAAEDNPETVRVVFKEFPILSAESRTAALAALAAGEQGLYNEMHIALMESRSDFSAEAIDDIAREVGVDVEKMRADMRSTAIQTHVADVRQQAIEAGAEATPTFFINGQVIRGFDQNSLNRILAEELDKLG